MSDHKAAVKWERKGAVFTDNRYSREHLWSFDGGIEVCASASPGIVPLPLSVAEALDPEEAFVASLAACHMLWFLSLAAQRGFLVESYLDEAVGVMGTNAEGNPAMTQVNLRPRVRFGGEKRPSELEHRELHHEAHERCFLAESVKSEIRCEPVAVGE
jgi:organic hydroperoxide reductase OsmC/OhrA